MAQNMSLPVANLSKSMFYARTLEVINAAFLLVFLMASHCQFPSPIWFLTSGIAVLLAFMVAEDAREQTVDIYLLSILAVLMFFVSLFRGQEQLFIKQAVIGACFFRFLLVLTSLWLTCRATLVINSKEALREDCSSTEAGEQSVGYLPIFAIVFILYLGLGTDFASFIFSQAAITMEILEELATFYPALPYIGVAWWIVLEGGSWWLEHRKSRRIIWAFGGGDVLFLGLFAGYLGLAPLLSLFFLSLIARVMFFFLQSFINGMTSV